MSQPGSGGRAVFGDYDAKRFFDEVFEWSGSVLLLQLAIYERWRWLYTK